MFRLNYIDPVFRPPSEADSLILQVTNGCSWNHCTFCDMYTAPQKAFRATEESDILNQIASVGENARHGILRVFLADGDALVLPTRRLLNILDAIRTHLPNVRRISSYCLPRNLRKKSLSEIIELREAGLSLVYVGAESGDDLVLERVKKGETQSSTLDALDKLAQAGIKRSVMILNGLGGQIYTQQHAENSARLANAAQPEFLATLVVSLPDGEQRFRQSFPEWTPLTQRGLFEEMERFLSALELKRTIFRSDHASNWLILKGTLGADKARLLSQVSTAINTPEIAHLRPAWARGL